MISGGISPPILTDASNTPSAGKKQNEKEVLTLGDISSTIASKVCTCISQSERYVQMLSNSQEEKICRERIVK